MRASASTTGFGSSREDKKNKSKFEMYLYGLLTLPLTKRLGSLALTNSE